MLVVYTYYQQLQKIGEDDLVGLNQPKTAKKQKLITNTNNVKHKTPFYI